MVTCTAPILPFSRNWVKLGLRQKLSTFAVSTFGFALLGVNSRVLRIGTQCAKGYDLADFTEAFARFLNSRS